MSTRVLHPNPMKTLAFIADDKAAAINGGFLNTTYFQQNQTATSGSVGNLSIGTSSASAFQGVAVGNTGTAFVGIGAFRFF